MIQVQLKSRFLFDLKERDVFVCQDGIQKHKAFIVIDAKNGVSLDAVCLNDVFYKHSFNENQNVWFLGTLAENAND